MIMHRDISMKNLAINYQHHLTLLDFGLAKQFDLSNCPKSLQVVTLWYRAPEILLGDD
jgi:serine/threonine protein kinase